MKNLLKIFKSLADPQRLKILSLLAERELCVCELQSIIGFTPATISQHLSLLSNAGLLKSRKFQKWVFYSIDWDALAQPVKIILETTLYELKKDKEIIQSLGKINSLGSTRACAVNKSEREEIIWK
ncbi:MAG: ArsR/SmtB family transcription factor [Candidatus Kapaibacteriota bacterium]